MQLAPKLLTDKSRLQEIYDLRVDAYEQSAHSEFVNRELYPNGWFDFLEEDSYHYIVEVENKIVASARLSILSSFQDFITLGNDTDESLIPPERPFALYSRLVISTEYRGIGISSQIDRVIIEKMWELRVPFCIAGCRDERLDSLLRKGFLRVGEVLEIKKTKSEVAHFILIRNPYL